MRFKVTYFKADGTTTSGTVADAASVNDAVTKYAADNAIPLAAGDEYRVATRVKVQLNLADSAQE